MSHASVAIEVLSMLGAGVILAGIPMAYFGLVLYRIYLAVLGFLVGGIFGLWFGIGAVLGVPITDGGVALLVVVGFAFVGAVLGAGLANTLHRLATALIGFLGGAALGLAIGVLVTGDPNSVGGLPLVVGIPAAVLAVRLEDWLIAISTSITGAVMVALPLGVLIENMLLFGFAFLFVGATGAVVQINVLVRSGGLGEETLSGSVQDGNPTWPQESTDSHMEIQGETNTEQRAMGGEMGSDKDPYDLGSLEEQRDHDNEQ